MSSQNSSEHSMEQQTSSAGKSETFEFTYSTTPNAGVAVVVGGGGGGNTTESGTSVPSETALPPTSTVTSARTPQQKQHSNTNNNNTNSHNNSNNSNEVRESLVDIDAADDDDEDEQEPNVNKNNNNNQDANESQKTKKSSNPEASMSTSLGILPPNIAAAADAVAKEHNQNHHDHEDEEHHERDDDHPQHQQNVIHHGAEHTHGKGLARRIRSHSGMRTVTPKVPGPSNSVGSSSFLSNSDLGSEASPQQRQQQQSNDGIDATPTSSARGGNNNNGANANAVNSPNNAGCDNANDDDATTSPNGGGGEAAPLVLTNAEEMQIHWSFSSFEDAKSNFLAFNLGVASEQGARRTMEDQHVAIIGSAENGGPSMAFFAVYDGHAGTQCAEYLRDNLHRLIISRPHFATDPESAVAEGVLKAEEEFIQKSKTDKLEAGSTVALAILIDNKTLVIGNVGDSEIVLSNKGQAVLLTTKHHLSCNKDEEARIKAAGGRIHNNRVGHPKFNPALLNIAVSRAVGDAGFKLEEYTDGRQSGLIADAQTRTVTLTPDDEFIVLACDGLWDVISYQDCVDLCRDCLDKGLSGQEISAFLADEAMRRQSSDNVTCMFVEFRRPGAPSNSSRSTSVNQSSTSARGLQQQQQGGPSSGRGSIPPSSSRGGAGNSGVVEQQQQQQQQHEATGMNAQEQSTILTENDVVEEAGATNNTQGSEEEKVVVAQQVESKPKRSFDNWDYEGDE